jgi:small subunit ribosomal protein S16
MLKIKLAPLGKKHEPHYRIVIAEENSKLTGSNIVELGHYHPLTHTLDVDRKQIDNWIAKGAQPTDKIRRLLKLSK